MVRPCALALTVGLLVATDAAASPTQRATRTDGSPVATAPPVELSGLLDGGHAAPTADGYALTGRGYRAAVTGEGLEFVPYTPESGPPARLALTLRALSSASGELELAPSGPPVRPGGKFGTGVVTPFADAGLALVATPRSDGVELEVWLDRRPSAPGDIRLTFGLDADLASLDVEISPDEHARIEPGGVGHVTVGRALAIDAAGVRTDLSQRVTNDVFEILLPDELLTGARYPLLVDPLLGTQLDVSASPGTQDVAPDVAFDRVTNEFIVVWERPMSPTVADIWGARVDAAGALAAGPFAIEATATDQSTRPRVAVDPNTGNYLVAYEHFPSGGSGRTVQWNLFDSADLLIATNSFTISGYLSDELPDVGYVDDVSGQSGFLVVNRRNGLIAPDSVVQVTWVDEATGAVIDSSFVTPAASPRDGAPAIPQVSSGNPTMVAFQRFSTTTFDLDVLSACLTLGGGVITFGTTINVSSDPSGADGVPEISSGSAPFKVVWEHVVAAASDRNVQGREVLGACAGLGGATVDITSLGLLETNPSVILGQYTGACDGHLLVLLEATAAPAGSFPVSILSRRWNSATGALGLLETLALGSVGVSSYSVPAAALDTTSSTHPSFLVLFDDNGTGANPAAEVLAQLYTFDEIPVSVEISPTSSALCAGGAETFTATVLEGVGSFTYQWRLDGVPIGGATSPSYTVDPAMVSDSGAYDVVVSGVCAQTVTAAATLTVDDPLGAVTISASPDPACLGGRVDLTATVASGTPQSFDWYQDAVLITTTAVPTLTLDPAQFSDAGDWTVDVSNACGSSMSGVLALTVEEAPAGASLVSSDPYVCEGAAVTLTASETAGTSLMYEFFLDGNSVAAASSSNVLVIDPAMPSDSGDYTVEITNACGTSTSAAVTLDVFPAPTTYCTATVNSLGCPAVMSWTGSPSASAGSGFDVSYGPVPGTQIGLFIYTTQGAASTPLMNAYGFVCIDPPTIFRTGSTFAGGTVGNCDGAYGIDFNLYFATQTVNNTLVGGASVDMQCWYRDPPNPGTANLTDALSFFMCP